MTTSTKNISTINSAEAIYSMVSALVEAEMAVESANLAARQAAIELAAKTQMEKPIIDAVFAARKWLYRVASDAGKYAPQSGHTTKIEIGTPSVKGESWSVWGRNFKATASSHRYTVSLDWIETVHDRGLAVVDGMFTLCASPVLGNGPELFSAKWVEQGRGCTLKLACGYIARLNGVTYHAPTARAAIDGVQRKAGQKPQRRKPTVNLDRIIRLYGELPVWFDDSSAVGNCESGTRSWCNAVGVSLTDCTLADVVRGYRLRPLPEAMAVIRRVIRDRMNRESLETVVANAAIEEMETEGRVVFDSEGGFRIENN